MARISGINLPLEKRIDIGLTYIHGIGLTSSKKILKAAQIKEDTRVKDLSPEDAQKISKIIEGEYKVEGELKQIIARNIRRLKDIKCYRGNRHRLGLPVRGQNTRTNAVTRKGRNIAVGGLNPKVTKT